MSFHTLRFDEFELDLALRELRRAGQVLPLRRKPMEVLEYLIEKRDRLVSKQELLEHVWPDTDAGEMALTSAIRDLRRALGDGAKGRALIASRRGHGYRFTAEVERGDRPPTGPRARAPGVLDSAMQLVGRAAELERLRSAFERAVAGRGTTAVLLGPLGVGKTALCEALADHARARGCDVHVGRCSAVASSAALWPCLQVLRSVSRTAERERSASTRGDAPDATRLEVAAQLLDRLAARAASVPQLLIVEDLQWADAESLAVIEFLAQSLEGRRVLLLVTARAGLPGAAHQRTLLVLTRVRADGIRCAALSATDALQIAARAANAPLPESVAQEIVARAGGIPLFLRELAQQHERPSASPDARRIPERIRDEIELHFSDLSAACQSTLLHASLAAEPFCLMAIAQRAPLRAGELLFAAAEAEAAGWLREAVEKPGRYAFVHPIYREVLQAIATRSRGSERTS